MELFGLGKTSWSVEFDIIRMRLELLGARLYTKRRLSQKKKFVLNQEIKTIERLINIYALGNGPWSTKKILRDMLQKTKEGYRICAKL